MHDRVSQWHSIRPWKPTLSLSVREITSVSATFILSSPLAASDVTTIDALHGDTAPDDHNEFAPNGSVPEGNRPTQIISEVLSKGLSIKVNGTPWQRVLMKIDDATDEAVIILFGLMPSRQYDIELGVVPGESTLRGQFTTDSPQPGIESGIGKNVIPGDMPSPEPSTQSLSTSSNASHHSAPGTSSPLASTNSHAPSHAPTPPPTFSLEDRPVQLTHALNLLNAEHATLTASLKTARREAQKADAALRSEIDTLKRASEKYVQQETRARQKVLALQEAVRQTVAATDEIKAMIKDVEDMLPELERRRKKVEGEWKEVNKQAKSVRQRRIDAEGKEKRKIEGLQVEMAGLGNKMERLHLRREKLEGGGSVIGELEAKLRKLEEQRTRIDNDPFGYEYDDEQIDDTREMLPREDSDGHRDDSPSDHPSNQYSSSHAGHGHGRSYHHNHPHHPRKRHSHPVHPKHPQPIQRPPHNTRFSLPAGPGVIHLNPANSFQPPHHKQPQVSSLSGQTHAASNLSSRAPPFEPIGIVRRQEPACINDSGIKSDVDFVGGPGLILVPQKHRGANAAPGRRK
ncbi:unnamed protein product [Somion occarium]|uniref:Uncharacterized protein n=1 Tax=Somion occarium TaxID=3059160 RepID=A0ABP1DP55_9APHY